MNNGGNLMVKHVLYIGGLSIIAVAMIFYPFFPGSYDSAAMGVSTVIQLLEVVGILLMPLGLAWTIHEIAKQSRKKRNLEIKDRSHRFALSALILASILLTPISLLILFGVGISYGVLAIVLWFSTILRLRPRLRALKATGSEDFNPAPLYLIFIPLLVLVAQILLARSATDASRNQAMANSAEMIAEIEQYHTTYGKYPEVLLAVWKDYYPDSVGVEKFHYVPYAGSYNLYFEQPRLFFDNFGTREFVVYNPVDEHLMLSHASWFMLFRPGELEVNQGWYEVNDATSPHWKYFWFD